MQDIFEQVIDRSLTIVSAWRWWFCSSPSEVRECDTLISTGFMLFYWMIGDYDLDSLSEAPGVHGGSRGLCSA